MTIAPSEREALPQKSQLRILPASSRYSRLLLSPLSPLPHAPDWKSWYIPGEATESVTTPYCEAADPVPADFEPVPAPRSFEVPVDVDGNLKRVGDILETDIYAPGDSLAVRERKQEEFWEWEHGHTLREKRWRERFGNPYTPLGQLQLALKPSVEAHGAETALGSIPEWVNDSRIVQLIVFYPPVLERLVKFLDFQALLGIMGTSVLLRRVFLGYMQMWKHISFAVRKHGFVEERDAAIKEDAVRHGSRYGAWAGSKLRFTSGLLRLGSSKEAGVSSFGVEARVFSSLPLAGLRVLDLDGSVVAGGRAFYDVLGITRSTLEILSIRFCKFVGVEDVEKVLVACAVRDVNEGDVDTDVDDDDDDDDEGEGDNTEHCFIKDPTCALKWLRIWGIQGNDSGQTSKTALPVELNRDYITRKAKLDKVVDIDQRKSFINGMFYIPHSIPKKTSRLWSNNPASHDITGRLIVIARQLGIATDFEDCDVAGDCFNHRYISRTSSEWKVGVPGLKIGRKCSECGQRKKGVMCRDCEEHRICVICKRFVCRACFTSAGNQYGPYVGFGGFYCGGCPNGFCS